MRQSVRPRKGKRRGKGVGANTYNGPSTQGGWGGGLGSVWVGGRRGE